MNQIILLLVLLSTLSTCAIHGVESTIDTHNARKTNMSMSTKERSWLNLASVGIGNNKTTDDDLNDMIRERLSKHKIFSTENPRWEARDLGFARDNEFNDEQMAALLTHALILPKDNPLSRILDKSWDARVFAYYTQIFRKSCPLYSTLGDPEARLDAYYTLAFFEQHTPTFFNSCSPDDAHRLHHALRLALDILLLDPKQYAIDNFLHWLLDKKQYNCYSVLLQHALDNESTDLINSMINDTRALGHDERFKIFSPLSKEHWLTNINGKEDFWEIYKNANINNDEIAKIFSAVIKEDWPTLYHIVGIKDFCKIYNKAKLMGLSPSEQDDRLKHLKQLLQEFKLTECRLIKRKTKLPRGVVGEIAKYF